MRLITKLSLVLVLATIALGLPALQASSSQGEKRPGFEKVAKTAIPAVVSIRVSAPLKQGVIPQGSGDPRDLFSDDFWQHFFGVRPQTPIPQQPVIGQGSGFIVSPDGYIVTNNHVVKDATDIRVALTDGREFTAKVVGEDRTTDLAIIKVEASDLPYLSLGRSQDLEVGQWVVAIGNPLGLQASLTVGVVSATGRDDLHLTTVEDFIQTDAAINRGNSGGPLLNLEGEVVGINTAIASNTGGYMGIGFAIPSAIVSHVMDQLIQHGTVTRGFLGVTLQHVDQDLAEAFGLNKIEGALVAEVANDSPASRAGLQQGDVILEVNERPVTSLASVRNAVALMTPGSTVHLTIQRHGKSKQLRVEIGEHPDSIADAGGNAGRLGFEVQALTPEICHRLGYTQDEGVVVSQVTRGSIAEQAGLAQGQLILTVNQQKVTSPEEFHLQLQKNKGNRLLLLVKQGRFNRFITLRFE